MIFHEFHDPKKFLLLFQLPFPARNLQICFECCATFNHWSEILKSLKLKLNQRDKSKKTSMKRKNPARNGDSQSKIIKLHSNEISSNIPVASQPDFVDKYTLIKSRTRSKTNSPSELIEIKPVEPVKKVVQKPTVEPSPRRLTRSSMSTISETESFFSTNYNTLFDLPQSYETLKAKFNLKEFQISLPMHNNDELKELMKPKTAVKKKKATATRSRKSKKTLPKNDKLEKPLELEIISCDSDTVENNENEIEEEHLDPLEMLNMTVHEDEIPISENVVVGAGSVEEFVTDPNQSLAIPELCENAFDTEVLGIENTCAQPMTSIDE